MKNIKSKELSKWDNRVIYNVKFRKDTKAPLDRLDKIFEESYDKFVMIAANSEALVYKIARYFISTGKVKNDDITFIDGAIIQSYIGDDSAEWKKKERTDQFFEIFGEACKNKWVLIPLMQFEISVGLAIYFVSSLKKQGAIGAIFYAEGPNNMTEILTYNTEMQSFYQFPKADYYSRRKRTLPADEW